MRKILEFLWGLLPDTCEVADCCRKGVRGNENIVYPFGWAPDLHIVMCDYCSSRYHRGEVLEVEGLPVHVIAPKTQVVEIKAWKKIKRQSNDDLG